MGRFTTRIARGLAALAVATTASSLLAATPAHALSGWTVDRDHVVLGASSTNSFKAFDGEVQAFYSGSSVRAELTGSFVGRGTLKATFYFYDGTTSTDSDYTAGVQHNIDFYPAAGKTVVKYNFTYTPNSGDVDSKTFYVGDSPDSVGSCTRLDQDNLDLSQSGYGSFTGNVWYGCTSDGHVYAEPAGTSTWANNSSVQNRVEFVIWYTDGSIDVKTTPMRNSSSTSGTVGAMSNLGKSVTWVNVRLVRWTNGSLDSNMPTRASKFGEDV